MKISDLAKKTKVSRDTLRYYEKFGLIKSLRKDNGYREFDENHLQIVDLIQLGKNLGFTLKEIKAFIGALQRNEHTEETIRNFLLNQVRQIDSKIHSLENIKKLLLQKAYGCSDRLV